MIMPSFYNLILSCCKRSEDFLEIWIGHFNSSWATEHFMLSTRHPEVTPVLLDLYVYCLHEGSAEALKGFRRRVLDAVGRNMRPYPSSCLIALDKMFEVVVASQDMIFVANTSIFAEVVALFAEPWQGMQQAQVVEERIRLVTVCAGVMCNSV
jgi:hypothetical protein